jgi:hypothetical protein
VGGLRFVLDKVASAVDAQLDDEQVLREELLQAQLRHELGELSAAELQAVEDDAFERLRAIRERRRAAAGEEAPAAVGRVSAVEVSFGGDEEPR